MGVVEAGDRRTHQLRAHMAHVGNPIVGDPKYFPDRELELPGGLQTNCTCWRAGSWCRTRAATIDATAPLPAHMLQSWNLLGLDASRYDPIVEAAGGVGSSRNLIAQACCGQRLVPNCVEGGRCRSSSCAHSGPCSSC